MSIFNRIACALVLLTSCSAASWADVTNPGLPLAALAQRAFDDTVSKFWFNSGVGSGLFDNLYLGPYISTISGITKSSPAVVTTATPHGYQTGQTAWISGETGMTQINGGPYVVTVIDPTDFSLAGVDSTSFSAFAGGGVSSVMAAGPIAAQEAVTSGALSDRLWTTAQSINVAYSWWRVANSPAALAKLTQQWAWVKNNYSVVQMQQCRTYGTAGAQDDAAWAAGGLLMLYEATGDAIALSYAQGMLDCAWTRWQDGTLGGGLWYDDTQTAKTAYQAQYALDLLIYYQDTGDATYLTKAEAEEAWLTAALFRNGQTVVAKKVSTVTVTLPYGSAIAAGNSASVTLTCSCISTSPLTITYTEGGSDTVATVASGLAALINGNSAAIAAGISAVAPGATLSVFAPAGKSLAVTAAVAPLSGGILVAAASSALAAGSYTYPSDGLLWMDTQPNGSAAYGVSQAAGNPYGIGEAGSVTMIEANMAYAVLEARLYGITGTSAYLTRLNQIATGIRASEIVRGTNIAMNDRDVYDDAFAAYWYAHDVIPLLTGAAGTQLDKSIFVATAWAAGLNDRCPDGTYGGSWEGPCHGVWWQAYQSADSSQMAVSVQAAAMIIAGYYASLH